jgi:hypothetical protein
MASRSRWPLGQICVALAISARQARTHRALDVRSDQFHETTGAVFDTLAQIHLVRGAYETASDFWGGRASYGAYGDRQAGGYEWSVRLGARLALLRSGALTTRSGCRTVIPARGPRPRPPGKDSSRRGAHRLRTPRRRRAAIDHRGGDPDPRSSQPRGEHLRLRGALQGTSAAVGRQLMTSPRARSASTSSANVIRRHSASSPGPVDCISGARSSPIDTLTRRRNYATGAGATSRSPTGAGAADGRGLAT